jgi:hypothetical protein
MGADFPLLSNEILLPNLVFFRSLLGSCARLCNRSEAFSPREEPISHR